MERPGVHAVHRWFDASIGCISRGAASTEFRVIPFNAGYEGARGAEAIAALRGGGGRDGVAEGGGVFEAVSGEGLAEAGALVGEFRNLGGVSGLLEEGDAGYPSYRSALG